jgi:hypothetical protein
MRADKVAHGCCHAATAAPWSTSPSLELAGWCETAAAASCALAVAVASSSTASASSPALSMLARIVGRDDAVFAWKRLLQMTQPPRGGI